MAEEARCAIETITPEQAAAWLANKNHNNRKMKESVWRQYAADMAAGKWRLNGQPIIFDVYGNLLDGQNRLQACVFAKVSFESFVHRNIEEDVFYTIDAGSKRSNADHLHRAGIDNARVISTAGRYLCKYFDGTLHKSSAHPSVSEIHATSIQNGRELNDAHEYVKALLNVKRQMPLSMATFCFAVFARVDRQKTITFFARLDDGQSSNDAKHDPIALLRNRFLRDRRDAMPYLFKAFACFREDLAIGRLAVQPDEEWWDLSRQIKNNRRPALLEVTETVAAA